MDKIDKIRKIWEAIPFLEDRPIDLCQTKLISQYLDIFHFGDCFYVIFNTGTAEMEYVSPNIEGFLGCSQKNFTLDMFLNRIHPDDLQYFFHYEQSAVRFFKNLSADLSFKYKFAYDYRLKTTDGNYKRFLQQTVPLCYFPDGGATTLTVFTDLTPLNITGIPKLSFIGMQGAPSYYNIHQKDEFLPLLNNFTRRETEILSFIVQGYTSEQISQKIFRSIHTVRSHRKNILEKSNCENITELIAKAIREGWV